MWLKVVNETALTSTKRDNLKTKTFGIPETRSYPMPDKEHVRYAIQMFDRCSPEKRDELAKNIIKFIKKYDMADEIHVSRSNGFYKYWKNR